MAIQDHQINSEYCSRKESIIADAISRHKTKILDSRDMTDNKIVVRHLAQRPDEIIKE